MSIKMLTTFPDARRSVIMKPDPTRIDPLKLKLGKQPARHDPRTLLFATYATAALPAPPVPPPAKAEISRMRRDEIAMLCKRRGLKVPEAHFEQLCATAPYVEEMVGHLGRSWDFTDEPANVFQFGA